MNKPVSIYRPRLSQVAYFVRRYFLINAAARFGGLFAVLQVGTVYAAPPAEHELPTGAQVVSGSANISQSLNALNVQQNSNRLVTSWQTFNIGSNAAVNFVQPDASSVALNRVLSEGASQIYGQLNANGQVYLINPSGVLFSSGSRVDVGGLVASTLDISNEDFLAGNTVFENAANGSVINHGHLSALSGGYIALMAPRVINNGVIETDSGTTALLAGEKVSLDFSGNQLVNMTVDQGVVDALIENKAMISADNGAVYMSAKAADAISRSIVNNTGVVEASGIVEEGGRIFLTADGGDVSIANTLDVSSDTAQGGDVIVTGDSITLAGNTTINARGATGGGDVLVGGDWQGSGDLHQATTVTMEEGASINASATNNGDGGKIVLWSDIKNKDSATSVAGTLTARGGANGGDGGAIETSGSKIDTANLAVDAGANSGTGGLWLIDPFSYIIDATAAGNISSALNSGTSVTVTTTADSAAHGSDGNAAGQGSISVRSAITKTAGGDATLTLKADRDVDGRSSITSTEGKLNLVLWADQDANNQGGIDFRNSVIDVTTNGGHIWIGGGSGTTTWNGLTVGDGAAQGYSDPRSGIQFLDATNITTAGGSIYMAADTSNSSQQDIRFGVSETVTIDAGGGSIELNADNIAFANSSTLETTGHLTIRSLGTSFSKGAIVEDFVWDGTRSGNDLIGASSLNGLIIKNVDSLGGLTLGKDGNRSEIVINADTSIAGDVSVYAGTIDVFGDLTAAGDILLDADTGSQLAYNGIGVAIGDATVSTTTASNGSITIEGRGGNDGTAQQGVSLAANSQITAGGTGDVTITGFGGDESSEANHHGILLLDNNGITAGGDIVLSGNGGGTIAANGNNDGVRLQGGKIGSDSSGSVTINGTTNADGSNAQDILIFGLGSEIRTGAGNDILLRGDSFNLGDNASGTQSTMIGNSTSTIGTLTFESVSDSFVDTGFTLPELTLANLGGLTLGKDGNTSKIIINPDTNVTGDVSVYAGTIDVRGDLTAAGDILLDADTGSQIDYEGIGVKIENATVSTTAASNGSITIVGRGGNQNGQQQGVTLAANSQLTAGGTGDVTITGFGGYEISDGNHHGILLLDNNGITAGGDIVLTGNGGGSIAANGNNDGVRLNGGKIGSDSSGSVTINGTTNANGSNAQDILIFGVGSEIRTGAGNDILLRGDSFGLGDNGSGPTPAARTTTIGNSTSTIGTLTFESVSDSFVDTGFLLPLLTLQNLGDLVVGKSTNTANVMIDPVLDLGGSLDIHGGDIRSFENWDVAGTVNINGDKITTAGIWNVGGAVNVIGDGETFLVGGPINTTGDNVLLKNTGDIEVVANASMTTLGGDITLWSDSDNNGNGYIHLEDNVTLNSETAGGTSGGGNITLAGGLDSNADGRPDGFASSEFASGVTFGLDGTNTTTMLSGGGNVVIRGKGLADAVTTTPHNYGIEALGLLTVDSGTGTISITGESSDNTAVFFSQDRTSGSVLDLKSAATSGDAIAITGTATGSSGVGVSFTHATSTDADSEKSLQATGGGDITITGTGVGSDFGIDMRNTDVLASTGDITFIGTGERIYLLGSTIGEKTGTDVVNSTSDIVLKSSKDVVLTESTRVQTGGGDITLWSDSNANSDGYVAVAISTVLDSRTAADRTAGTHTSGGGNITLSGGSDLATGYAQGNSDDGVFVEGQLYSGGGDILVRGKSNTGGSGDHGVVMLNGTELLSGVGSISVTGQSDSGNGIRLSSAGNGTITLSSSKASGDAIVIDAQSSGTYGLYFNQSSTKKELSATGGGDIRITGDTTAAGSFGIYASYTQLLAASGTITLDAGSSGLTGGGGSPETDLVFGAEAGSSVTASSSDVNIISDLFRTNETHGFGQFVDTTGHLTIAPSSTAFDSTVHGAEFVLNGSLAADTFTGSDDVATVRIRSYSTLGGLTVGKQDSTSNIAINSAQTIDGDINLLGGDISLNAALTAGGANTISLTSSGNVTDSASGYLVADNLALLGGNVTLDHASNNVTTLAASGVGNVTYSDSNALTIGVVDTNSGIAATGAIDVSTLSDNLTTTELVSGSSVILNAAKNTAAGTATGGNLLFSGSSNVTASSGNALLYSGSIAGSTGLTNLIGSGSGNFRYNSDEAATNYSAALGASGNHAIYREQPSVTVVADNETVTYGTTATLASSLSSAQNGDTLGQALSTAPSIAVGGSTSSSGNYTAGSHSLTASGAVDQLGYAIAYTAGTLTVNQKTVTTTLSSNSKEYDGTTTASISASANGVLVGDVASVNGAGAFANKNVGTNKAIDVTGLNLSGTDSANYVLDSTTGTTSGDISRKGLTVSGITAANKTYDGTATAATDFSSAVYTGLVSGDVLALSSVSGAFDNKNAGTDKTVNLSSSYSGADAGNYTIVNQATTIADIEQRDLTVSGITADDKVYDGNTTAMTDFTNAEYSGLVNGDELALSTVTGSFDNKNAASNKTVSLSSSYNGADLGNYTITDQASTIADITQKGLTVSGITASNKTYDGATTASLNFTSAVYTGLLSGDAVALSSVSGMFSDKNAGANKTVSLSSSYGGADLGNYNITDQASTLASISQKGLTVSGITGNDKTYDGNTTATADFSSAVYTGLVSGDELSLSSVTAVFDNKNVAAGKTVSLSSSYDGADVGNYAISDQISTLASISQKALTISGITASDKTYDRTTTATTDFTNAVYTGLESGDAVVLSNVTGTFDDKNAGADKTVNLSSSYSGADADNYSIVDQANTLASISPKSVIIDLNGEGSKTYDGTSIIDLAGVTPTLSGFIAGDNISVDSGNVTGYVDKNVGTNKFVEYTGFGIAGSDAANYAFSANSAESTASIFAKDLTVSGITVNDKIYNGDTTATTDFSAAVFTGLIASDDFALSSVTGVFDNKNAGTDKTVSLSSGYSGADITNYTITDQDTTTASVAQKELTISGITAENKVYDGNTAANIVGSAVELSGLIAGDDLSLATTSGTFDDKNVGTAKQVALSNTYSGTDLENYLIVDQQTTSADIAQKVLTVSGIAADNKVYDRDTAVTVHGDNALFSGLVAGDDFALRSTSGVFGDRNAGTAKNVTLSNAYSGTDVTNYSIVDQTSTTADITQKELTVSGITAQNKVYDGSVAAEVDASGASIAGIIAGDTVTLDSSAGEFSDKNAGSEKAVLLSNTYSGDDIANYSVIDQGSTTADIAQKALTISGIAANDKSYDGTDIARFNFSGAEYEGLVAGDDLELALVIGTFADANAGELKTVSISSTTYRGVDLANYAIQNQQLATATIGRRTLTVTANDDRRRVDGSPYQGGNGVIYNGFVADEASENLAGSLSFMGSSQGATLVGEYDIIPAGLDSMNYELVFVGGKLQIEPVIEMPEESGSLQQAISQQFEAGLHSENLRILDRDPVYKTSNTVTLSCSTTESCTAVNGVCVQSKEAACD